MISILLNRISDNLWYEGLLLSICFTLAKALVVRIECNFSNLTEVAGLTALSLAPWIEGCHPCNKTMVTLYPTQLYNLVDSQSNTSRTPRLNSGKTFVSWSVLSSILLNLWNCLGWTCIIEFLESLGVGFLSLEFILQGEKCVQTAKIGLLINITFHFFIFYVTLFLLDIVEVILGIYLIAHPPATL